MAGGGAVVPERPKMGSGKKFSITIQVPDDVAAQWPERATAEKLIQEVYTAMGGTAAAPRVEAPRARRGTLAILLAGLFAGGVIGGYLGARGVLEFSTSPGRPVTAPRAAPVPARPTPSARPASPAASPQADLSVQPAPAAAEPQPSPAIVLPVPAGPAVGAPATVFNVQVGAYRVRENAEALIAQLRQDGFKAHVVQFSSMYLVQMGTLQTRSEADRLVAKLKAKHYDAYVIQLSTSGN